MSRAFVPSRRARLLVGVATASFALVAAAAVTAASGPQGAFIAPADSPAAVVPPDDLGDDAALNELAGRCFGGDLMACDLMFLQSPVGSPYEEYGDTCAGRQAAGGEQYCILGRDDGGVPLEPSGSPDSTATESPDSTATESPDSTATESPDSTVPSGPGTLPSPTMEPTGLGDDPELDELAQQCYDGEMAACDSLYGRADSGSDYQIFGDTCAGRQPEGTGRLCVIVFEVPVVSAPVVVPEVTTTLATEPSEPSEPSESEPTVSVVPGDVPPATVEPTGLGSDAALDALAQSCFDGDMEACDDLWRDAEPESAYREYGDTCAGRQPPQTGRWCTSAFPGAGEPTAPTVPDSTVATETTTLPVAPTVPASTTLPLATTTTVPASLPGETVPGSTPPVIPPPTVEPTGLGDDPVLDALAQECYDGSLQSCDDLWRQSELGTEYHGYGDTCAGRQPAGTGIWCVDAFASTATVPPTLVPTTVFVPPPPSTSGAPTTVPGSSIPPPTQQPTGLGGDPALDALAQQCYDGDMLACDALFDASPLKTPYHTYGDTCAGRQPAGTFKYCRAAFPSD